MDPRDLLHMFASGDEVSGAAVAQRLGVTRAAVWKQIDLLRQRGLPIGGQAGSGYRLPWPLQLLDTDAIRAALPTPAAGLVELHWELDSTSSELQRRQATAPDLSMVLAECQRAARGRRGRRWLSPPGLNIYLSCLKRFEGSFASLSGLSLAVGVAVMRALEQMGIHGAGLKWPNDVLAGPAKLAGILVELSGEYQGPCTAIIGIGLNLRMPTEVRAQVGQPVTDLADLNGGTPPDRNRMAAALVAQLATCMRRFEAEGFEPFRAEYNRLDLLRDRPLHLSGPHGDFDGTGLGVDARGALRVRTADGDIAVDSADVTVRRT